MMIRCPCGQSFDSGQADRCPACGRPCPAPGTCPDCGVPLADDAVLCVACGYDRRSGKKVTATPRFSPAPATEPGLSGRAVALGLGAILLLVGIACWFTFFNASPPPPPENTVAPTATPPPVTKPPEVRGPAPTPPQPKAAPTPPQPTPPPTPAPEPSAPAPRTAPAPWPQKPVQQEPATAPPTPIPAKVETPESRRLWQLELDRRQREQMEKDDMAEEAKACADAEALMAPLAGKGRAAGIAEKGFAALLARGDEALSRGRYNEAAQCYSLAAAAASDTRDKSVDFSRAVARFHHLLNVCRQPSSLSGWIYSWALRAQEKLLPPGDPVRWETQRLANDDMFQLNGDRALLRGLPVRTSDDTEWDLIPKDDLSPEAGEARCDQGRWEAGHYMKLPMNGQALSTYSGYDQLSLGLQLLMAKVGPDDPRAAAALLRLGFAHYRFENPFEAELVLKRARTIYEAACGGDHPDLAPVSYILAAALIDQGKLDEAETEMKRAMECYRRRMGDPNPMAAALQYQTGRLRQAQHRYADAAACFAEEMRLFATDKRQINGPLTIDDGRRRLADSWYEAGCDAEAEKAYLEMIPPAPAPAQGRGPLTSAHTEVRGEDGNMHPVDSTHWERPKEEAPLVAPAERVRDLDQLDVARRVITLQTRQKRFADAEPVARDILSYTEKFYGREHPATLDALERYVTVLRALGREDEAGKLEAAGVEAAKLEAARYPGDVPVMLRHLAYARWAEAAADISRRNAIAADRAPDELAGKTDREKSDWTRRQVIRHQLLLDAALRARCEDPLAAMRVMEEELHFKSIVTDVAARESRAAHLSGDPAIASIEKELAQTRSDLASAEIASEGGQPSPRLAGLRDRVETLQKDLAGKSAPFARRLRFQTADAESVRRAIPDDAAFIAYFYVCRLAPTFLEHGALSAIVHVDAEGTATVQEGWFGVRCYAAVVVRKDRAPVLTLLAAGPLLSESIETFRERMEQTAGASGMGDETRGDAMAFEQARRMSAQLILPIYEQIRDKSRWIISPDAGVAGISFAMLPEPGTMSYLGETREISYVASGRDLVNFGGRCEGARTALVLADPDFDGMSRATAASPAGVRLAIGDKLADLRWSALPGTREEGASIARILRDNKYDVHLAQGADAAKGTLMTAKAPGILHIATHGFFIDDEMLRENIDAFHRVRTYRNANRHEPRNAEGRIVDPDGHPAEELWKPVSPLFESGIALAGANRAGEKLDGLATAYELLNLNLWGTQVVVLSACDTGRGGISVGQGVTGLQQSFLTSGAQTVVSSLWPVPDRETSQLMTEFYRGLFAGQRASAALRDAMARVRGPHAAGTPARHPLYWGAFVLVGDPSAIEAR